MPFQTPLEKYKSRQKTKFQAYVEKHINNPELSWLWVSRVPLLDLPFLRKWKSKSWNWQCLSRNSSFSKQDKQETKDEFPWSWFCVEIPTMEDYLFINGDCGKYNFCISNVNIVEDIKKFPDFGWNWKAISLNKNINEEFVLEHKDKLVLDYLAGNPALSLEFLKQTMHKFHWNTTEIAQNPNVNAQNFFLFFNKHSFKCKERANNLTENESISLDFIFDNLHFEWNRELLNFRADITKEHILRYPDFEWNWGIISSCKSVDKKFLLNHSKTNFNEFYSYHSGLIIDEVEHLSPNQISCNLLLGTLEEKIEFLRKFYAARVIGNAFFNCYWHYEYAYCKKRLNKRYDELFHSDLTMT
uniref:Uncharacterized protein n=1 Tax=viral metagenome TaxID=1070528 RepID=A0A6C0KPM0_9ZZZZ